MASTDKKYPLIKTIRQSPPLEFPGSVSDTWLSHKTILITGGASGFGEGFVRRWAAAGATIIFGDINVPKGTALATEVSKTTGNSNVHFRHCDVTSWDSQVALFKAAIELSPHGGIDGVVANAGIADSKQEFEKPSAANLSSDHPKPPNLDCINVNITGVLYTTHLALYHLPRNPGSLPASPSANPKSLPRDRHLLLLGSVASIAPISGQSLYGASKHAVLGLYRCLRSTVFVHGIRINMLCPYFIDTPILTEPARIVLAGGTIGKPEDVVEAGTRFAADPRIAGRAAFVGPRLRVEEDEDGMVLKGVGGGEDGEGKAIWEIYAADFEDSDLFQRNIVGILNRAVEMRGWAGWASDWAGVVGRRVKAMWGA